jgi:hypothetical protein
MSFLNLNGWAVPIVSCEPSHIGISPRRGYSPNGIYQFQRNSYARSWSCRTGLLTSEERDVLTEMLGHRGDGWRWSLQGTAPAGVHTDSKFFYSDKRRAAQSAEEVATVVSAYAADGARVYDWNYNPVSPCEGSEGAVCVDEGSTNLYTANRAHPTANGHLTNVSSGTHAADSTRFWTGSGAVNVNCTADGDGVRADFTATIGQPYVLSAHVYAREDDQVVKCRYWNSSPAEIATVTYTLPTAGSWYRLKVSGTQTTTTTGQIRVTSFGGGAMDFGIDGLQAELQTTGHPTAWIAGGSPGVTRAAGILDYDLFTTDFTRGITISAWVNHQTNSDAVSRSIVDIGETQKNQVRLYRVGSGFYQFLVYDGQGNSLEPAIAESLGVHHIVGVYDRQANSSTIYVDGGASGVTDSSWNGADGHNFWDASRGTGDFSIGTFSAAGSANWHGTIGSVQILPYPVPASVVTGWYDSGSDARAQPGVLPMGAYGDFTQFGEERVDVYGQLDSAPHEPWWNGATFEKRGGRVAFTLFEAEKR